MTSFTDPMESIADYRPWFLSSGNDEDPEWIETTEVEIREQSGRLLARIDHSDSRTEADHSTGRLIGVEKDSLPQLESDEFYWIDLVGLQVRNEADLLLGSVVEVFETGAHAVLRVGGETNQLMIPFVGNVVLSVESGSHIVVAWEPDW